MVCAGIVRYNEWIKLLPLSDRKDKKINVQRNVVEAAFHTQILIRGRRCRSLLLQLPGYPAQFQWRI